MLDELFSKGLKVSYEGNININRCNDDILIILERSCDLEGEERESTIHNLQKGYAMIQSGNNNGNCGSIEHGKKESIIIKADDKDKSSNITQRNFQIIIGNKKTKNARISNKNKQYSNRKKTHNERYFNYNNKNGTNIFIMAINDIYVKIRSFIREIFSKIKWRK